MFLADCLMYSFQGYDGELPDLEKTLVAWAVSTFQRYSRAKDFEAIPLLSRAVLDRWADILHYLTPWAAGTILTRVEAILHSTVIVDRNSLYSVPAMVYGLSKIRLEPLTPDLAYSLEALVTKLFAFAAFTFSISASHSVLAIAWQELLSNYLIQKHVTHLVKSIVPTQHGDVAIQLTPQSPLNAARVAFFDNIIALFKSHKRLHPIRGELREYHPAFNPKKPVASLASSSFHRQLVMHGANSGAPCLRVPHVSLASSSSSSTDEFPFSFGESYSSSSTPLPPPHSSSPSLLYSGPFNAASSASLPSSSSSTSALTSTSISTNMAMGSPIGLSPFVFNPIGISPAWQSSLTMNADLSIGDVLSAFFKKPSNMGAVLTTTMYHAPRTLEQLALSEHKFSPKSTLIALNSLHLLVTNYFDNMKARMNSSPTSFDVQKGITELLIVLDRIIFNFYAQAKSKQRETAEDGNGSSSNGNQNTGNNSVSSATTATATAATASNNSNNATQQSKRSSIQLPIGGGDHSSISQVSSPSISSSSTTVSSPPPVSPKGSSSSKRSDSKNIASPSSSTHTGSSSKLLDSSRGRKTPKLTAVLEMSRILIKILYNCSFSCFIAPYKCWFIQETNADFLQMLTSLSRNDHQTRVLCLAALFEAISDASTFKMAECLSNSASSSLETSSCILFLYKWFCDIAVCGKDMSLDTSMLGKMELIGVLCLAAPVLELRNSGFVLLHHMRLAETEKVTLQSLLEHRTSLLMHLAMQRISRQEPQLYSNLSTLPSLRLWERMKIQQSLWWYFLAELLKAYALEDHLLNCATTHLNSNFDALGTVMTLFEHCPEGHSFIPGYLLLLFSLPRGRQIDFVGRVLSSTQFQAALNSQIAPFVVFSVQSVSFDALPLVVEYSSSISTSAHSTTPYHTLVTVAMISEILQSQLSLFEPFSSTQRNNTVDPRQRAFKKHQRLVDQIAGILSQALLHMANDGALSSLSLTLRTFCFDKVTQLIIALALVQSKTFDIQRADTDQLVEEILGAKLIWVNRADKLAICHFLQVELFHHNVQCHTILHSGSEHRRSARRHSSQINSSGSSINSYSAINAASSNINSNGPSSDGTSPASPDASSQNTSGKANFGAPSKGVPSSSAASSSASNNANSVPPILLSSITGSATGTSSTPAKNKPPARSSKHPFQTYPLTQSVLEYLAKPLHIGLEDLSSHTLIAWECLAQIGILNELEIPFFSTTSASSTIAVRLHSHSKSKSTVEKSSINSGINTLRNDRGMTGSSSAVSINASAVNTSTLAPPLSQVERSTSVVEYEALSRQFTPRGSHKRSIDHHGHHLSQPPLLAYHSSQLGQYTATQTATVSRLLELDGLRFSILKWLLHYQGRDFKTTFDLMFSTMLQSSSYRKNYAIALAAQLVPLPEEPKHFVSESDSTSRAHVHPHSTSSFNHSSNEYPETLLATYVCSHTAALRTTSATHLASLPRVPSRYFSLPLCQQLVFPCTLLTDSDRIIRRVARDMLRAIITEQKKPLPESLASEAGANKISDIDTTALFAAGEIAKLFPSEAPQMICEFLEKMRLASPLEQEWLSQLVITFGIYVAPLTERILYALYDATQTIDPRLDAHIGRIWGSFVHTVRPTWRDDLRLVVEFLVLLSSSPSSFSLVSPPSAIPSSSSRRSTNFSREASSLYPSSHSASIPSSRPSISKILLAVYEVSLEHEMRITSILLGLLESKSIRTGSASHPSEGASSTASNPTATSFNSGVASFTSQTAQSGTLAAGDRRSGIFTTNTNTDADTTGAERDATTSSIRPSHHHLHHLNVPPLSPSLSPLSSLDSQQAIEALSTIVDATPEKLFRTAPRITFYCFINHGDSSFASLLATILERASLSQDIPVPIRLDMCHAASFIRSGGLVRASSLATAIPVFGPRVGHEPIRRKKSTAFPPLAAEASSEMHSLETSWEDPRDWNFAMYVNKIVAWMSIWDSNFAPRFFEVVCEYVMKCANKDLVYNQPNLETAFILYRCLLDDCHWNTKTDDVKDQVVPLLILTTDLVTIIELEHSGETVDYQTTKLPSSSFSSSATGAGPSHSTATSDPTRSLVQARYNESLQLADTLASLARSVLSASSPHTFWALVSLLYSKDRNIFSQALRAFWHLRLHTLVLIEGSKLQRIPQRYWKSKVSFVSVVDHLLDCLNREDVQDEESNVLALALTLARSDVKVVSGPKTRLLHLFVSVFLWYFKHIGSAESSSMSTRFICHSFESLLLHLQQKAGNSQATLRLRANGKTTKVPVVTLLGNLNSAFEKYTARPSTASIAAMVECLEALYLPEEAEPLIGTLITKLSTRPSQANGVLLLSRCFLETSSCPELNALFPKFFAKAFELSLDSRYNHTASELQRLIQVSPLVSSLQEPSVAPSPTSTTLKSPQPRNVHQLTATTSAMIPERTSNDHHNNQRIVSPPKTPPRINIGSVANKRLSKDIVAEVSAALKADEERNAGTNSDSDSAVPTTKPRVSSKRYRKDSRAASNSNNSSTSSSDINRFRSLRHRIREEEEEEDEDAPRNANLLCVSSHLLEGVIDALEGEATGLRIVTSRSSLSLSLSNSNVQSLSNSAIATPRPTTLPRSLSTVTSDDRAASAATAAAPTSAAATGVGYPTSRDFIAPLDFSVLNKENSVAAAASSGDHQAVNGLEQVSTNAQLSVRSASRTPRSAPRPISYSDDDAATERELAMFLAKEKKKMRIRKSHRNHKRILDTIVDGTWDDQQQEEQNEVVEIAQDAADGSSKIGQTTTKTKKASTAISREHAPTLYEDDEGARSSASSSSDAPRAAAADATTTSTIASIALTPSPRSSMEHDIHQHSTTPYISQYQPRADVELPTGYESGADRGASPNFRVIDERNVYHLAKLDAHHHLELSQRSLLQLFNDHLPSQQEQHTESSMRTVHLPLLRDSFPFISALLGNVKYAVDFLLSRADISEETASTLLNTSGGGGSAPPPGIYAVVSLTSPSIYLLPILPTISESDMAPFDGQRIVNDRRQPSGEHQPQTDPLVLKQHDSQAKVVINHFIKQFHSTVAEIANNHFIFLNEEDLKSLVSPRLPLLSPSVSTVSQSTATAAANPTEPLAYDFNASSSTPLQETEREEKQQPQDDDQSTLSESHSERSLRSELIRRASTNSFDSPLSAHLLNPPKKNSSRALITTHHHTSVGSPTLTSSTAFAAASSSSSSANPMSLLPQISSSFHILLPARGGSGSGGGGGIGNILSASPILACGATNLLLMPEKIQRNTKLDMSKLVFGPEAFERSAQKAVPPKLATRNESLCWFVSDWLQQGGRIKFFPDFVNDQQQMIDFFRRYNSDVNLAMLKVERTLRSKTLSAENDADDLIAGMIDYYLKMVAPIEYRICNQFTAPGSTDAFDELRDTQIRTFAAQLDSTCPSSVFADTRRKYYEGLWVINRKEKKRITKGLPRITTSEKSAFIEHILTVPKFYKKSVSKISDKAAMTLFVTEQMTNQFLPIVTPEIQAHVQASFASVSQNSATLFSATHREAFVSWMKQHYEEEAKIQLFDIIIPHYNKLISTNASHSSSAFDRSFSHVRHESSTSVLSSSSSTSIHASAATSSAAITAAAAKAKHRNSSGISMEGSGTAALGSSTSNSNVPPPLVLTIYKFIPAPIVPATTSSPTASPTMKKKKSSKRASGTFPALSSSSNSNTTATATAIPSSTHGSNGTTTTDSPSSSPKHKRSATDQGRKTRTSRKSESAVPAVSPSSPPPSLKSSSANGSGLTNSFELTFVEEKIEGSPRLLYSSYYISPTPNPSANTANRAHVDSGEATTATMTQPIAKLVEARSKPLWIFTQHEQLLQVLTLKDGSVFTFVYTSTTDETIVYVCYAKDLKSTSLRKTEASRFHGRPSTIVISPRQKLVAAVIENRVLVMSVDWEGAVWSKVWDFELDAPIVDLRFAGSSRLIAFTSSEQQTYMQVIFMEMVTIVKGTETLKYSKGPRITIPSTPGRVLTPNGQCMILLDSHLRAAVYRLEEYLKPPNAFGHLPVADFATSSSTSTPPNNINPSEFASSERNAKQTLQQTLSAPVASFTLAPKLHSVVFPSKMTMMTISGQLYLVGLSSEAIEYVSIENLHGTSNTARSISLSHATAMQNDTSKDLLNDSQLPGHPNVAVRNKCASDVSTPSSVSAFLDLLFGHLELMRLQRPSSDLMLHFVLNGLNSLDMARLSCRQRVKGLVSAHDHSSLDVNLLVSSQSSLVDLEAPLVMRHTSKVIPPSPESLEHWISRLISLFPCNIARLEHGKLLLGSSTPVSETAPLDLSITTRQRGKTISGEGSLSLSPLSPIGPIHALLNDWNGPIKVICSVGTETRHDFTAKAFNNGMVPLLAYSDVDLAPGVYLSAFSNSPSSGDRKCIYLLLDLVMPAMELSHTFSEQLLLLFASCVGSAILWHASYSDSTSIGSIFATFDQVSETLRPPALAFDPSDSDFPSSATDSHFSGKLFLFLSDIMASGQAGTVSAEFKETYKKLKRAKKKYQDFATRLFGSHAPSLFLFSDATSSTYKSAIDTVRAQVQAMPEKSMDGAKFATHLCHVLTRISQLQLRSSHTPVVNRPAKNPAKPPQAAVNDELPETGPQPSSEETAADTHHHESHIDTRPTMTPLDALLLNLDHAVQYGVENDDHQLSVGSGSSIRLVDDPSVLIGEIKLQDSNLDMYSLTTLNILVDALSAVQVPKLELHYELNGLIEYLVNRRLTRVATWIDEQLALAGLADILERRTTATSQPNDLQFPANPLDSEKNTSVTTVSTTTSSPVGIVERKTATEDALSLPPESTPSTDRHTEVDKLDCLTKQFATLRDQLRSRWESCEFKCRECGLECNLPVSFHSKLDVEKANDSDREDNSGRDSGVEGETAWISMKKEIADIAKTSSASSSSAMPSAPLSTHFRKHYLRHDCLTDHMCGEACHKCGAQCSHPFHHGHIGREASNAPPLHECNAQHCCTAACQFSAFKLRGCTGTCAHPEGHIAVGLKGQPHDCGQPHHCNQYCAFCDQYCKHLFTEKHKTHACNEKECLHACEIHKNCSRPCSLGHQHTERHFCGVIDAPNPITDKY